MFKLFKKTFATPYNYYKKELETAEKLEAEYVVFHACYVDDEGSLIYEFQYSDKEVLQNVAKLVNEVFGEKKYKLNFFWKIYGDQV